MSAPAVDRLVLDHLMRAYETAQTGAQDAEAARIAAANEHYAADRAAQEASALIDRYAAALSELGVDVDHLPGATV